MVDLTILMSFLTAEISYRVADVQGSEKMKIKDAGLGSIWDES